jgi:methyl-accepting chemotaxis protein
MAEIEQSSHRIAEIIGMIEGIAFQTNILALTPRSKPHVPASRARYRRGCGRSAQLGAAIVHGRHRDSRVDRSIQHARPTLAPSLLVRPGETMTKIGSAIQKVTDIMDEIASASNEQSRGIEQVNTAIAQMDEVTQQNAALVEQAAAAAGSLQDQAETLRATMAVFKTEA